MRTSIAWRTWKRRQLIQFVSKRRSLTDAALIVNSQYEPTLFSVPVPLRAFVSMQCLILQRVLLQVYAHNEGA